MRHAAGYHKWMAPESIAPGRARSLCSECGLVVEHQARKRPGLAAAGRVVNGKAITSLESIPTCGGAKRIKYQHRHAWHLVGDAPPSPRGAPCNAWSCTRCGLQVEVIKSSTPGAACGYTFLRYMGEDREWKRGFPIPRCVDAFDDDVKAFIADKMAVMTARSMAAALGVSGSVIKARAKRLKAEGKVSTKAYHTWTEEDDRQLAAEWRPTDISHTARMLRRSVFAVMYRAKALDMVDHRGCPRGYEYLSDAERRLGFSEAELKTIIRYAGIKPIRAITAHGKKIKRTHIYDADRLTEVVDAWLSTVRVGDFAREHVMEMKTLRRWLSIRGIEKPENMPTQSWRLPQEVLDDTLHEARVLWSCNRYAVERHRAVGTVVTRARWLGIDPNRNFDPAVMDEAFERWPPQPQFRRKR